MLIGNLVPGVIKKLRNRTDLTPDIPLYLRKAILEISENYEFEKLKVTGPIVNFTVGVSEYPVEGNNCPFIADGTNKITFINSWFVWFNDTTPVVGVDTGFEIKNRNLRVVEPMSQISGIPTFYCKHGGSIIVGYAPNDTYSTRMRYQRQHPFPTLTGNTTLDGNTINSLELLINSDWQDIIEYAAAMKAADDVGMNDVATLYSQRLFGYKDTKGNEVPGIIFAKMSQQQRDGQFNEKQLRPVIRKY